MLPRTIRMHGASPNWIGRVNIVLVFVVSFVFTSWISELPAIKAVGLGFQDALLQTSTPRYALHTKVVNITPSEYERVFGGRSPLDPKALDALIDKLSSFEPAVLVIDIDTSSGAFRDRLSTSDRGSTKLVWARCIAGEMASAVICAIAGRPEREPSRTGIALYPADIDGRFRLFPNSVHVGSRVFDTIHWAAVKAYCESHDCPRQDPDEHDAADTMRPRFRERLGLSQPLGRLLETSSEAGDNIFRDRIVIVGTQYSGSDLHSTPIGEMNGSDIIGQLVEADLTGDLIREPDRWMKVVLKLSIGLLILSFNRFLWPFAALLASVLVVGLALISITLSAFYFGAVLFDLLAFSVVLMIEQAVQSAEIAQRRTWDILRRHAPGVSVAAGPRTEANAQFPDETDEARIDSPDPGLPRTPARDE